MTLLDLVLDGLAGAVDDAFDRTRFGAADDTDSEPSGGDGDAPGSQADDP